MTIICWVSITLNFICSCCFFLSLKGSQEKTGRDMTKIIGNLLLIVAVAGSVPLIFDLTTISLLITIVPALIVCRIFFRVIKEY